VSDACHLSSSQLADRQTPTAFQLVTGRVWKGCAFGGIKGRTQLPDLVDDYMNGKLKVDEFITHRQPLANINTAFQDMKAGDCIRCVVNMRKD
jgi:S-(hydroxymethyl)glutathione dehydrogenase / alcohol dehydrogenase